MRKRDKSKIIYMFFILIFVPSALYGQENRQAFKTISISADYLQNVNDNMFHTYWKPANRIDISGATEFYFGRVELGAGLSLIKAKNNAQPDFKAVNMYIGWGLEYKLLSKLSLYSGFTVGNYLMYFDDDNIDINLKSESEFSIGLKSGVKYKIGKNYFINLYGAYQIVYTYHRIELFYISIGLGKTFTTPTWLREFLN